MAIDIRFDPFKNIWEPHSTANEILTVPANSPYRIRLAEVPQKTSPTSLAIQVADTLAAAATAAQTTLTVSNGAWFAVNDVILVDSEYMLVTDISSNILTVSRGYESTTPVTHAAGANVVISDSMQEVATSPSSGQFWPDYNTEKGTEENWNTGTLEFNAQDAGKRLLASYMGIGTLADRRVIGSGYQIFTDNGEFKVPRGITKVFITGCGGGAGGGAFYISNGTAYPGAAGGQVIEHPLNVEPDMFYAITIGTGGAGRSNTAFGYAGGASSFGNLLTLTGGSGSANGTGGSGVFVNGSGLFGIGGASSGGSANGGNATGYGSGGGANNSTYSGRYGGAGTPGFLLIKWYPEKEF